LSAVDASYPRPLDVGLIFALCDVADPVPLLAGTASRRKFVFIYLIVVVVWGLAHVWSGIFAPKSNHSAI
jgi:hypothetical protein